MCGSRPQTATRESLQCECVYGIRNRSVVLWEQHLGPVSKLSPSTLVFSDNLLKGYFPH